MITIAVINESPVLAPIDLPPVVSALQTQVSRDFAPLWLSDSVQLIPAAQAAPAPAMVPPSEAWQLVLLDNSDQAEALGYHDLTDAGQPLGKVFVKDTMDSGGLWTVTASHELLEMLGDPWLCKVADAYGDGSEFYMWEACDPIEGDQYGYKIDGITVSNFVTDAWFRTFGVSGEKLDFMGCVSAPLQLLPGGYIGKYTPDSGRIQETNFQAKAPCVAPARGSRRERRIRGQSNWQRSRKRERKRERK